MIVVGNPRMTISSCTDTQKAFRHIPVLRVDELRTAIPVGCTPIAIDLLDGATPLPRFVHPERGFYIFGPEDGTLSEDVLEWCVQRVVIPTRYCMNLAATVNVVLYDRLSKRGLPEVSK